jgi:hypothetical protein
MNGNRQDDNFVDGVRTVLRESESQLDSATLLRLRSSRLKALEMAAASAPWYARFPRWVTAGGLATAAVCLATLSFWFTADQRDLPVAQVEDVEILTTQEQLDLYKDLDFYRWLEESERAG